VFENLIESKQKNQRTLGQTVLSVLLHGLVIVGAVKATQGVAESVKNRPVDTTMVFLKPPEPPKPPPDQPPPDVVVAANPPPKGFQTVVAPTDIPKDIPPIDLNEKPFDPRDFTGKGVEGGIGTGIEGGTGPVTGEVFLEAQLDDPVQVISQPQPRYPPVLASAGITGRFAQGHEDQPPGVRRADPRGDPEERVQAGQVQGPAGPTVGAAGGLFQAAIALAAVAIRPPGGNTT
jgi:hypothetical protein